MMISQPASFSTSNPTSKRKRSLPGTPDPDADVIALSPNSLMATNRFVCEICNKGFQRDQNLQLHRRGHNLPWKLRTRAAGEQVRKKVYVCPEKGCVHSEPSRALGDLTGIKKHFSRKHGEKNWKCQKCSKKYAVQSDWKAHSKVCGTKEYRCDCGTLFSRKDSFVTHRAFCDALSDESVRLGNATSFRSSNVNMNMMITNNMNVSSSTIPQMPNNFPPNFATEIFCGSPFSNGFQEFHQTQNPTYIFSQQNQTDWQNTFPPPTILKQEDERYGNNYPENQSFNDYHHHHHLQYENNMTQSSSSKPYVVVDENDDDNLNELLCDLNWNNNGGGSSLLGECRGLTRDFLGVGEENRLFRKT